MSAPRTGSAIVLPVLWLVAATHVGWAQPAPVAAIPARLGPSFDCSAVHSPGAKLICSNTYLSRLDLIFVQAYYALRQQVGEAGWKALKVEAVEFENTALEQCGIPTAGALPDNVPAMASCLSSQYRKQRNVWLSRLSGPALEEARRPIEEHVALQRDLQILGYLPANEKIDGIYGSATRAAILAWQISQGITPNQFLGDADAKRLEYQASQSFSPTASAAMRAIPPNPSAGTPVPQIVVEEVAKLDSDYRLGGTSKIALVVRECAAKARNADDYDLAARCLTYTFAAYLFDEAVTSYAKFPPSPGLTKDKIVPVLAEMLNIMAVPETGRASLMEGYKLFIERQLVVVAQSKQRRSRTADETGVSHTVPAASSLPPQHGITSIIPLREQAGTMVVPVLINGAIRLNFVIDSGASDVSIPADVVLTLIRAGTIDQSDFLASKTYTLADGSTVPSQTFRIRSLKVGDVEIRNVIASVGDVRGTLLLGQSFLRRFASWSIDNHRNALVLVQ